MNTKTAKLLTCMIPNKKLRRSARNKLLGIKYNIIPEPKPDVIAFTNKRADYGHRKVAILTNVLLDWETNEPSFGGGERYALNIAKLLKSFGFEVHFYQIGYEEFKGEYYGFPVYSIKMEEGYSEFNSSVCNKFYELTKDYDHVYYNTPELCSGKMRADAIMTCHGIWFDHNNYLGVEFRYEKWFKHLGQVFSQPKKIVSVDTNSINVIRSFWPELANNMTYIPNFVDTDKFKPDISKRDKNKLRVLFPRRSQINRGSRILGDILKNIPYDVDIYWVGEGDAQDTQIIKNLTEKDKRLKYYSVDFDQMPEWYQKCDIAVIPTIACEGTSLSAVEALASGCAIVTTNIGGLSNLFLDGYNGIMCDPDAKQIAQAINKLIEDNGLRKKYQEKAVESAQYFSLKSWQKKWVKVFLEENWISPKQALDLGFIEENEINQYVTKDLVILTRNAIHGGVESLIAQEVKYLNADVIVCGGADFKETTPFEYTRADNKATLLHKLNNYSKVLYHWIPDYALDALEESKKTCIEFVHREDVNNCNRPIADRYISHSQFLADYTTNVTGKECDVVPHPIDTSRFVPAEIKGNYIGGVTSYYKHKGIDLFIKAWAKIRKDFPEIKARFYGQGSDLNYFKKLSNELNAEVEFLPPTTESEKVLRDFKCIVSPSRIEGMPVAILEALAMNIPVITSNLKGMVEFKKKAESNGFSNIMYIVKYEDVKELEQCITKVLTENTEVNTRGYIEQNFNPKKHCEIIQNAFNSIKTNKLV